MYESLSDEQLEEVQSENLKAYIAGVFDSTGTIFGQVKTGESYKFGYRLAVTIRLETNRDRIVMLFEDWCHDHGMNPSVSEQERKTTTAYRVTFNRRDDVRTLLSTLSPFLLDTADNARLVLNEILPLIEEHAHKTREGFIEIVELMDQLHEGESNREYNAEYFRELWADEL